MIISCSHCSQQLEVDSTHYGTQVVCPSCGGTLIVPTPSVKAIPVPSSARPAPTRNLSARTVPPPPPPVVKRSGGVNLLLILLVLATGSFVFGMIYYGDSPLNLTKRIYKQITTQAGGDSGTPPAAIASASVADALPTPSPVATPAVSVSPTPEPTPESTPTPLALSSPEPTATPDSLSWLLEHRNAWPKEVKLLRAIDFPILVGGQLSGKITAAVGTVLPLVNIDKESLTIQFGGSQQKVPVAATDIEEQAPQLREKYLSLAQSTPALPVSPIITSTPTPPPLGHNSLHPEVTQQTFNPPSEAFPLWSHGAPGAHGTGPNDIPTLTPFFPPKDQSTGAAMIICPGGAYAMLAKHEGEGYAVWLNEQGITAFVLQYRLGSHGYRHPSMMLDAQRAMRYVRSHAAEWKLDPKRIGIIGSSAGGHLASTVMTHFDAGDPGASDPVERVSCRPDIGVLCYPVITMGPNTHEVSRKHLLGDNPSPDLIDYLSNEKQVTKKTPPTFLFHCKTDNAVKVENSIAFADALEKAGVPVSLHVYPNGGHGIGLGDRDGNIEHRHPWTRECETWLRDMHFGK